MLANAQKIKYYKKDKGTKIFVSKFVTKKEQIKEKECLIKRFKLINEKIPVQQISNLQPETLL